MAHREGEHSRAVHHTHHDVYSESLPIPSIQRFFKKGLSEVIRSKDVESEEEESSDEEENADDKETSKADKGGPRKPETESNKSQNSRPRKGQTRRVVDPVTGREVPIHDVGKKEYRRAMEDASPSDTPQRRRSQNGHAKRASTSSTRNAKPTEDASRDTSAAAKKKKTHPKEVPQNALQLPFPPEQLVPSQPWQGHPLVLPLFALWSIVTLLEVVPPIVSVVCMSWMGWWTYRTIYSAAEDHRWNQERKRGQGATMGRYYDEDAEIDGEVERAQSDGLLEGAEWLNSLLESLWSVLNSDLFSSLGSTLEDVLQASTHGQAFIQAVKVEDLSQGSTPIRLTGFRVLKDRDAADIKGEANSAMQEGSNRESQVDLSYAPKEEKKIDDVSGNGEKHKKDSGGSFINFELSFVYRAKPTTNSMTSKSQNAHLLIKFWVGAHKLYHVPLPVWVEVKGFVGKVRARLQLTPDPPFIKNVTFAFMGLPRTEVSVIPLRINAQNIPFLSGFIQKSMDAAIGEYCAPSSMTIDLGEMLMGDSIKREVNALGVVMIYIHRAFDLEKQDVRGSSDPYCTIAFKKYSKVQYCTRVALDDLSPRWEERCHIMITPEAVRAKEKICISLWDSDRLSADDILGQAEVDLESLVRRPGKVFRRTDTLVGLTKEMKMQGTVQWSVGFFKKAPNTRGWRSTNAKKEGQHGNLIEESKSEDGIKSTDEQKKHDANIEAEDESKKDVILPEDDQQQTHNKEQAVSFEKPDSDMPAGILSLQVHQITHLELIDTKTHRSARRTHETAQKVETMEDEREGQFAPSPYVTIIVNDETVFRSRIKSLNSNPFFNAGTEKLVSDWTRTLVMFVVWDSRLREEDAILGVIPLKLSDVFKESSQVTQFFPLAGGVGLGRVRISLLFRPLEGLGRHKEKLGWNIGTMRLQSSLVAREFEEHFSSMTLRTVHVRARTMAGKIKLSSRRASMSDRKREDSGSIEWVLNKNELPIKVPVRRRYASPFIIEFRSLTALGTHKTIAMSIVWMQDLADDEVVEEKLPIWQPKDGYDFHRLEQNYHNFRKEHEAEAMGVERVGYLFVSLQFKSGVGRVHARFGRANPDAKAVMQAWKCCAASGLRSLGGDFVNLQGNEVDSEGEKEVEVSTDDSDPDEYETDGHLEDGVQPNGSRKKQHHHHHHHHKRQSREGNEEGEDAEKGDGREVEDEEEVAGMFEKLRKWSEEKKELHRQQRGIKQYKAARTASWMGRGIRNSGYKALHSMHLQEPRSGQIETEL